MYPGGRLRGLLEHRWGVEPLPGGDVPRGRARVPPPLSSAQGCAPAPQCYAKPTSSRSPSPGEAGGPSGSERMISLGRLRCTESALDAVAARASPGVFDVLHNLCPRPLGYDYLDLDLRPADVAFI